MLVHQRVVITRGDPCNFPRNCSPLGRPKFVRGILPGWTSEHSIRRDKDLLRLGQQTDARSTFRCMKKILKKKNMVVFMARWLESQYVLRESWSDGWCQILVDWFSEIQPHPTWSNMCCHFWLIQKKQIWNRSVFDSVRPKNAERLVSESENVMVESYMFMVILMLMHKNSFNVYGSHGPSSARWWMPGIPSYIPLNAKIPLNPIEVYHHISH